MDYWLINSWLLNWMLLDEIIIISLRKQHFKCIFEKEQYY